MVERSQYLEQLRVALGRSPVVALLGPRQCGKTTLARQVVAAAGATWLDLELPEHVARLANPQLYLAALRGLVVIDEVQLRPDLFGLLRPLVDRPDLPARFLLLGSASPAIVRHTAESLAGRVEAVELAGFDVAETGTPASQDLWVRGGLPRSFLAASEDDSMAWREGFVQALVARDLPQLGLGLPPVALRRFWTMLAHWHGQLWNASALGRALGVSDKTVRAYLDLLTGAFLVRQLQPWHANVAKRQVKAPKVYLRDSGLLHTLLALPDRDALLAHPSVGASWEGFCLEQVLRAVRPAQAYFWSTHGGAEIDLLFAYRGRWFGVDVKWSEQPAVTKSLRIALDNLQLAHAWMVYPGTEQFPLHERVTALPLARVPALPELLAATST